MHDRRDFITQTIGGTSLLALGSVVPEFLASAAIAAEKAEKGKDTILVVIEMTGGNDGLNTVVPFGDDLYHKARPKLAISKKEALKLDDYCGLHPCMSGMKNLFDNKKLAVIRGVGYPNPNRSHFESMDIWQLADPNQVQTTGWLARTIPGMNIKDAGVPGMFIGDDRLPVALQGADGGVISLADRANFKLKLTGNENSRKKLIQDLNGNPDSDSSKADLAAFVRKRQLQTYTSLQKIEDALKGTGQEQQNEGNFRRGPDPNSLTTLNGKLGLIARLIQKGLGTRIYYVQLGGFDTHANQEKPHGDLLFDLSNSINNFFNTLGGNEVADRVALMTYSEFGRRVKENGSIGTDHGSGSCMFVAGNKVAGGLIGKHPSLSDLTDGDLRYHTDFRRVYASLLDDWLGVESRGILGDTFEQLKLIDMNKKPGQEGGKEGPKGASPPGASPPGASPPGASPPEVGAVPPPPVKE